MVGLVARTVAECMPSAASKVGVIAMSAKPAASSPSRYSVKVGRRRCS
ncbi:hypothetical protein [Lentzea terrae]|nr:hypothetical protein [Lentzea terrae]